MEMPVKAYVNMTVSFDESGRIKPRSLAWEDGRKYVMEKLLDCKPAAAMRADGQVERFTVRINGHESYLFFERSTQVSGDLLGKWFLERRGMCLSSALKCTPCQVQNLLSGSSSATNCDILLPLCRC